MTVEGHSEPGSTQAQPIVTAESEPQKDTQGRSIEDLERQINDMREEINKNKVVMQTQNQFIDRVEKKKSRYEEIADKIYLDPTQALREHEELIMEKIEARQNEKNTVTKFWGDIYEENPKLKLIDSVLREHAMVKSQEWRDVPLEELKKKVADYGKKLIKDIGGRETEEELPHGNAQSFPSLGARNASVKPAEKLLSFVDQIKSLKKNK